MHLSGSSTSRSSPSITSCGGAQVASQAARQAQALRLQRGHTAACREGAKQQQEEGAEGQGGMVQQGRAAAHLQAAHGGAQQVVGLAHVGVQHPHRQPLLSGVAAPGGGWRGAGRTHSQ